MTFGTIYICTFFRVFGTRWWPQGEFEAILGCGMHLGAANASKNIVLMHFGPKYDFWKNSKIFDCS